MKKEDMSMYRLRSKKLQQMDKLSGFLSDNTHG